VTRARSSPSDATFRIAASAILLGVALMGCRSRHAATDTMGLACLMSEHNLFAAFGRRTPPPKIRSRHNWNLLSRSPAAGRPADLGRVRHRNGKRADADRGCAAKI
jgi:hypothetical protein